MFSIQASRSHYFLNTKPLSFKLPSLSKQISSFTSKALSAITNPSEKKLPTTKTLQLTALFCRSRKEREPPSQLRPSKVNFREKPPGLNQTNPSPTKRNFIKLGIRSKIRVTLANPDSEEYHLQEKFPLLLNPSPYQFLIHSKQPQK
ncbi:hypothetical protein CDAR_527961 [Caerostris darwini]|uniref:Ribosomal protein S10 n=1 Tax=Caerostris darwini TaxID=1538125 RepID=A0AAV4QXP1_9ARAC|nr:hypothetical protein CDAR_527961 [Caerostris darwini]